MPASRCSQCRRPAAWELCDRSTGPRSARGSIALCAQHAKAHPSWEGRADPNSPHVFLLVQKATA